MLTKFLSKSLYIMLVILVGGIGSACSADSPDQENVIATTVSSEAVPSTTVPAATQASVVPQRGSMGSSTAFASAQPDYSDLAYATLSATQKLDLYLPEGEGPFPLVIMVHGGGFMMGDKADGMGLAGVDQLLAAGYAVSSINYRLSGEATYPAQIYDAKAAVRFLRANAAEYRLDPLHFGAWGASAGGNLVALLGTTCGVAELEGAELGNADQSSCVQAVVDWFGPIDFLKMDAQFEGTGCPQTHDAANSPESMLVGAAIQTVPDLVMTTNPMNYIDPSDAPFIIQHGTADCNIPPIQGQYLADALSSSIGTENAVYTLIEGAGHGGSEFGTEANLQLILEFLDSHLK